MRSHRLTSAIMDIDIEEHIDVFAARDLWRPSRFALPHVQSQATLFPDLELDSERAAHCPTRFAIPLTRLQSTR